MINHLLIQQRRRAASMMRLLLRRAGYPLAPAGAGYPSPRHLAPDQFDLPLYEPANIRGFFWGPEEEEEMNSGSPGFWAAEERSER